MKEALCIVYLAYVLYILYCERISIKQNILDFQKLVAPKQFPLLICSIFFLIVDLVESAVLSNHTPVFDLIASVIRNGLLCLFAWIAVKGKPSRMLFSKINPFLGIVIFSICFATPAIIPDIFTSSDPQHLNHATMTGVQALDSIIGSVTTGVGEESLKLTSILGVISILILISRKHPIIATIIASLVTSGVFGGLHGFSWGNSAAFWIGVANVISVFAIVAFRNIWIPMIAHFAFDTSEAITLYLHHSQNIQWIVTLICIGATLLAYLAYLFSKAFNMKPIMTREQ